MIYKFIDTQGTFIVKNPHQYNLYFPLTNQAGSILSSISPNLSGDIKKDNQHFLTPPVSIEDIRSSPLTRREFFIKTSQGIIRLSRPYNDSLEAGLLYHKIKKETKTLNIEITNFVPYDMPIEVMRIRIKNKSKKNVSIIPTSFIPLYGRAEKNLRDHRHVSSLLNRITLLKYGIILKPTMIFDEAGHSINKVNYFVLGFEGNTIAPLGQFPTLDYFYGKSDIFTPDAITKDIKPINKNLAEFDGKEVCASFRFRTKELKPGEEVNYSILMGIEEKEEKIKGLFLKLNTPQKIDKELQETKQYWLKYLSKLEFDFKDNDFNNWLLWVKLQPALRKLFGCSFLPHFDYGKGGRGWRDLWQDILTLLLIEPEKAKGSILNNFKGIRIDGSNATIITKDGGFISDRNRINRVWMDHGVWPYLTLKLYINRTGDLGILLKDLVYFSDHQVKRAKGVTCDFKQNDFILRDKDKKIYQGSVLEHILVQNLVQFFNVGKDNIIRLENADWNDGLDMAAENGESVAFSFMYAYNLKDLCYFLRRLQEKRDNVLIFKELAVLLDRLDRPINYASYKAKQKRLAEYFNNTDKISGKKIKVNLAELINDLEAKSNHLLNWLRHKEWLATGFFNGYYDNQSRQVEGKFDKKIKMLLASQVFAIMSGGATEGQIKKIRDSLKRFLWDKKLGGFHLNTNLGAAYLDLGRAFGFSYGDKENGAFFSHMVVMLANALYKRGFSNEGFWAFNSIYKMATNDRARIYPVIPEYFNNQGRGLYLYLTGSASWYIYTLVEELLGIRFILGDILIDPGLIPQNFYKNDIQISFSIEGKKIKVNFTPLEKARRNTPFLTGGCQVKSVFLAGKAVLKSSQGYLIKKQELRKENLIRVYLG